MVLLANKETLPGSSVLNVSVFYTSVDGEPRTTVLTVRLPMCLFVLPIPPVKSAKFKLTLDTNRRAAHQIVSP